MEAVGIAVAGLAMMAGLVLTLVPLAPGLLVIWLAALVHLLASGLDGAAWTLLVLLTVLGLIGFVGSLLLPQRGAEASGASRTGVLGGLLGAIVGAIVLPALGFPIGGLLGLFATERMRQGSARSAWRATVGALRGLGLGTVVEAVVGTIMVSSWLAWVILT